MSVDADEAILEEDYAVECPITLEFCWIVDEAVLIAEVRLDDVQVLVDLGCLLRYR